MENQSLNYYRVKLTYQAENDEGAITTFKDEHLVQAVNYTEAECLAYALAETLNSVTDVDIEIVRTKIEELAYNDTFNVDEYPVSELRGRHVMMEYYLEGVDPEEGLYAVTLIYVEINEKTGKLKHSTSTIYMPAASSKEAIDNTAKYLKAVGETREYTVRNVKYDKAISVLVDAETHKKNIHIYDNY